MLKIVKKEQVEMVRVEVELELTFIDGELQDADRSFTVADVAAMLAPVAPEVEFEPAEDEETDLSPLESVIAR